MDKITALDLGAGNIKRYSAEGGLVLPAQAATFTGDSLGAVAGLKAGATATRIDINGYRFYVGEGSHRCGRPIENLDDSRFIAGAPELRAMVYAALPMTTEPQHVIVGLPQSALTGEQAGETVSSIKRWMQGSHEWKRDEIGHVATVQRVTVTSQAAGALFDYLLDEEAHFIPARRAQFKDEIGIVSIGMNTVEFLVVQNGETINRFTGSITAGVRRLLDLVDPRGLYSRGELDALLRAGRLDVRDATPIWASEIAGHVERIWGKAFKRFAAVCVVGGGALLLRNEMLGLFNGKSYLPDDPVISVARGLYKLALMKASK